jgi:hypothetical protein
MINCFLDVSSFLVFLMITKKLLFTDEVYAPCLLKYLSQPVSTAIRKLFFSSTNRNLLSYPYSGSQQLPTPIITTSLTNARVLA